MSPPPGQQPHRLIQPLLSAADTSADTSAARELLHVFEVFNEMRAAGVEADNAAFNALINACAEAGDMVRAEAALGQMMRTGLTPDVISYNSCIASCERARDWPRAVSLLEEMRRDGPAPDSYSYNHPPRPVLC